MISPPPTVVVFPGLDGTGTLTEAFADGDWQGHPVRIIPIPKEGPQDYPSLVAAISPSLPAGRLIVIGESFSGPLAMQVAAREKNRVNALVIVGGFCASPAPSGLALMPLRPLFLMTPPAHLLKKFMVGPDAGKELVALLTSTLQSVPSTTFANRARVVLALVEEDCPVTPGLPVLLVQAQHDALISWEHQSRLERHFPEAQVTWIDSPHLLLATHPDPCRAAIIGFLGQLQA